MTNNLDNIIIEIEDLFQQVNHDLEVLDQCIPSERVNFQNEIQAKLNALETKIARLKNESRSLPPTKREYYTNEINSFQSQHTQISSEFKKQVTLAMNNPAGKQASQLEANIRKSQGINENLDEAIRLGNDAITTGNATLNILEDDRKRINHINENIDVIDREAVSGVDRAKRMVRRACFNNFIIWAIVILLVGLLGFSLYWKLKK